MASDRRPIRCRECNARYRSDPGQCVVCGAVADEFFGVVSDAGE